LLGRGESDGRGDEGCDDNRLHFGYGLDILRLTKL
jgi:hypothetical protein